MLCCLLLPAGLVGCATLEPPEGYVKLRNPGPYDFKAVSHQGNAIALSSRPNEDRSADLDFWAAAVEHQKVDVDGMKLAGRREIRSRSGLSGVLFTFETGEGQNRLTYLVALYVTPDRVYTIEAAGLADAIAADTDKLRQSMESFH
jgi:hypothetical protein